MCVCTCVSQTPWERFISSLSGLAGPNPLGGLQGCYNLHVAEMTPQPHSKVAVMMMSACDCLPPPSPALLLMPATGGDTEQEEGEAWLLYANWNLGWGCYLAWGRREYDIMMQPAVCLSRYIPHTVSGNDSLVEREHLLVSERWSATTKLHTYTYSKQVLRKKGIQMGKLQSNDKQVDPRKVVLHGKCTWFLSVLM